MHVVGSLAVAALAFSAAAQAGEPVDRITQARARERYEAGRQLLFKDAFAAAAGEFRAAADLDPTMALAYYGLGQAYMGLKSYTQAIRAYAECRRAYEELMASTLDKGARLDKWINDEIIALKDQQRLIEAQIRQGGGAGGPARAIQLQRALSQITNRITQYEHMRQRSDRTDAVPAGVALALGSAYLRAGQLRDAEREYLLALQGNPKMGEAHNNLAYVYMVTGRLTEAEQALKLAEKNGFRVNPRFKEELNQKLE